MDKTMGNACSILICNRWAEDAVILTIESVLKRTDYPNYKIVVCDNSEGKGEASRLDYLKDQERRGNIKLIENVIRRNADGKMPYGHGENLKVLIKQCDTPYAMLFSSGSEVKNSDWLNQLIGLLETDKDLGVAKTRKAENHFQNCWAANRYIPNWMLLNMDIYRKFGNPDEDWSLKRIPYDEYEHKEAFEGLDPPQHPDPVPLHVFLDTGWRLWERIHYENPEEYRMVEMPFYFPWRIINFFGGMDRNAHRPDHPYVVKTRRLIQERLRLLRRR